MQVIRKDPGKPPKLVEIPNTLKALQQAVGGYIETVTLEQTGERDFLVLNAAGEQVGRIWEEADGLGSFRPARAN